MRPAFSIACALLILAGGHAADGKPRRAIKASPSIAASDEVAQQSQYRRSMAAEQAAVKKTQGLLADKFAARQAEMKQRVRALYKLSRASFPRLWIDAEERRKVAQWLGAARRITTRDQDELRLLQEEIDVANAAQARLHAIENHSIAVAIPRKSLLSPLARTKIVGAYGEYQGPSRKVRLRRRGVELKARIGEEVKALAPGRVVYVGPVSGLGQVVIVEHDGYISLVGRVQVQPLQPGDLVPAGGLVGHASGTEVYLEIRLQIGSVGQTVDPEPLLRK
jgi:septal ring factor EnvC (AmiA/AmiB activator)